MTGMEVSRRKLLIGGASAAVLGTSGALTAAGPAAAVDYAVHSAIPKDASGYLNVLHGTSSTRTVVLSGGRISVSAGVSGFPFPVEKVIFIGDAGGPDGGHSSMIAIRNDGYMYGLTRYWKNDSAGKSSQSWSSRRYGPGWLGTEDMVIDRRNGHLFRLTTNGTLTRYRFALTSFSDKQVVFSAGGSVRSIAVDRTVTHLGAPAAVLLANTTHGDLREYIVPLSNPSQWRSRILRPAGTGWQQFSKLTVTQHGNGRIIMGMNDALQVRAYFDPNRSDFVGTDIRGGATSLPTLPADTRPA